VLNAGKDAHLAASRQNSKDPTFPGRFDSGPGLIRRDEGKQLKRGHPPRRSVAIDSSYCHIPVESRDVSKSNNSHCLALMPAIDVQEVSIF
jgi:hypothetical protein